MLTIDIHTHIIPDNLPDLTKKFGYEGFVKLEKKNESEADMILFNENFRTIQCNCWNPQKRISDMKETGVDVQVISPIPIMFSYWADAKDALVQSQMINDFISEVCTKYPKKFITIGAKTPRGALLLGPPGSGKTLIKDQIIRESFILKPEEDYRILEFQF